MRPVVLIPLVLAYAGMAAVRVPAAEAGAPDQKQEIRSSTERDHIVAEVLRLFLKDIGTAETAKKRFSGVVETLYIRVTGGAQVNLQEFTNDSHRLKTASGTEFGRDGCVDAETRQPCAVIELSVNSLNGDVAIASVFWMQSPLHGGGLEYQLRKKGGIWQIEGIVGVSSI